MKPNHRFFFVLFFLLITLTSFANGNILWTSNWSSDGKYIAVGGVDGILRIYDGNNFELIQSDTLNAPIFRLRWHPTENILAIVGVMSVIQTWNIETGKRIKLNPPSGSRSIAWNHDGKMLAIADYEGFITIWSKHGQLLKTIQKETTKSYVAIDWHPCKNEIIALSEDVYVYNLKGELLQQFAHRKESVLQLCVEWHPSGVFFVIGDYGDTNVPYPPVLQFWTKTYKLIASTDISKAAYRNISWSTDGKLLATASDNLRIWSKEGKPLYEGFSEDNLWGIDWRPDGKYIVTSSGKSTIKIWNNKAELVKELKL